MNSQIKNCLILLFLLGMNASTLDAQIHSHRRGDLSPGAVGMSTRARNQNVFGYVQPSELTVPSGSQIAFFQGKSYEEPRKGKLKVGLRIGDVYRFKITRIKGFEGLELYPSVEINCTN